MFLPTFKNTFFLSLNNKVRRDFLFAFWRVRGLAAGIKTKMTQGMYHYIKQAWKKPDMKILRERMIQWRASEAIEKVDKPLRLDRARNLGYKDKKGFTVARIRLRRGGHKIPRPIRGRR